MATKTRYMMATKAIHQLGDISRDKPDLCYIHGEDDENFIGNWATGFGFIEVRFPKSSTRELSDDEKSLWRSRRIVLSGCDLGPAIPDAAIAKEKEAQHA